MLLQRRAFLANMINVVLVVLLLSLYQVQQDMSVLYSTPQVGIKQAMSEHIMQQGNIFLCIIKLAFCSYPCLIQVAAQLDQCYAVQPDHYEPPSLVHMAVQQAHKSVSHV